MARIVFVDDSIDVRRATRRVLSSRGFTVDDFAGGEAAWEAISALQPDLIVSDVQMPGMDGLELTRRLRQRFDKSELPIVLVSGLSDEEDIVRGFEAGANDYILKPYQPAELLAKVSILLRERPFLRQPHELALARTQIDVAAPTEVLTPVTGARPFSISDVLECQPDVTYFLDKYEIRGEYGRGGMGAVYRGVERDGRRPVALKVLAPALSADRSAIARFLRESKILGEVECDNVVKVYDHGYDNGLYFLAMEAVEGQPLDKLLARNGPFSEALAVSAFVQLARALQAISAKGLVHRDVKPPNVLLRDDGHVKLVDFGISKHEQDESSVSAAGAVVGTPYYIAPELIEGGKPDARSDLYALGVSFFEVLAGQRPFAGAGGYEIFQHIVSGHRPSLLELRPSLNRALLEISDRLLERDPNRRYQRADEVEADLLAVVVQ